MNGVGVDRLGEVSTDGAGSSFFRVGSAHQLTVQSDGVFAFQNLYNDRAGSHEGNQVTEEAALAVLSVEPSASALDSCLIFEATIFRPASSKRVVILPMTFLATASG